MEKHNVTFDNLECILQDNDGNTSLHLAARFGQAIVLQQLLAAGQGWDVAELAKVCIWSELYRVSYS